MIPWSGQACLPITGARPLPLCRDWFPPICPRWSHVTGSGREGQYEIRGAPNEGAWPLRLGVCQHRPSSLFLFTGTHNGGLLCIPPMFASPLWCCSSSGGEIATEMHPANQVLCGLGTGCARYSIERYLQRNGDSVTLLCLCDRAPCLAGRTPGSELRCTPGMPFSPV